MPVNYDEQKNYWENIDEKRRQPDHAVVRGFAESKINYIREVLPQAAGRATMLEVGAGNGFLTSALKPHFDLWCLDFSHTMLARNPLPEARKVQGLAESLPFEDNEFDIVFCANLLHHLENPLDAVREMKRVAKHHVILLEPNALNPMMFAFGALKREERGTLKFFAPYMKLLGLRAGLELRAYRSLGVVLPNKLPEAALPFALPFDALSQPLGFYQIAIFDVD